MRNLWKQLKIRYWQGYYTRFAEIEADPTYVEVAGDPRYPTARDHMTKAQLKLIVLDAWEDFYEYLMIQQARKNVARVLTGKATVNQIREEVGLPPLEWFENK